MGSSLYNLNVINKLHLSDRLRFEIIRFIVKVYYILCRRQSLNKIRFYVFLEFTKRLTF